MVEYEIKGYIVFWHDVNVGLKHEEHFDTEEAACVRYKELIKDNSKCWIGLEKILSAITFPWDED